jgi:hypothetical protein
MKATLIKRENHYDLFEGTRFISTTECEDGTVNKLSKQNCDEIFGVVDVEKLAKEEAEKLHDKSNHEDWDVYNCLVYEDTEMIKIGFNKAMELNKDKQFTLEDLENFRKFQIQEQNFSKSCLNVWLQSLQQPTEIEVEIEMEVADLAFYENGERYPIEADLPERFKYKSKLDADGCLILKKKGGCY